MENLSVRSATSGDVPTVYKWFLAHKACSLATDLNLLQGLVEFSTALVAVKDGQPLGFISCMPMTNDLHLVAYFMVKAELRGKGIGSRLLEALLEKIQGKNVWTNADFNAMGLYKKFGFVNYFNRNCHLIRGHPEMDTNVPSTIPGVELVQGHVDLFQDFLDYGRTVFAVSDALERFMSRLAESGGLVLAKRSSGVVGALMKRDEDLNESVKVRKLILFADDVQVAILLLRNAVQDLQKDRVLILMMVELTDAIRAVKKLFKLDVVPIGHAMFSQKDCLSECMDLEKMYALVPI